MNYFRILLSLLLLSPFFLLAQDNAYFNYCGTVPGLNLPFIDAFHARPEKFPARSSDTLWMGVQLHLLADDNGSGRVSGERILDAFCQLNKDYEPSQIRFLFKQEWNQINNAKWFMHDSLKTGVEMMLTSNVADAFNTYFVSNPAGNAGYNLPYAGVALKNSEASLNNHTWTHEIGHALALEHTFIGWEGKKYDPNLPTPDTVTYNYTYFHDTLDTTIPAPDDIALVEYVDGSNCGIAADRICDSKPDYLSYPWECNAQGMSTVQQKDPAGAAFRSDGSLYMSYAADNCQNRFSPEQIQIMRAYLLNQKAAWIVADPQIPVIADLPQLESPANNQTVPANAVHMQWQPTPGATHYLVQISRLNSFAIKEQEIVVTDTFAVAAPLLVNKTYYWRVRPFNEHYTCSAYTAPKSFVTVNATGVQDAAAEGWRCYPTLLAPGSRITLEISDAWLNQTSLFRVYDTAGRLRWESSIVLRGKRIELTPPVNEWSAGMYYLVCSGKPGVLRHPVLVVAN